MRRTCIFLLLSCLAGTTAAADTLRYVALVDGGKQAGHQTITRGDDGVTRVDFIFKDNGRGPELKEEFTLADDGTYRAYRVEGVSTFGAKVDETFSLDGGNARWKSTSDAGEKAISGTALYSPLGGTPAGASVALGAMAKRGDAGLPLIPSGTLRMRKLAEAEVRRDDETRTVQLVAVTGVGFTPQFLWATTDDTPRLFAFIFPGFLQLIEDGWQANADALETQQEAEEGKALVDLRARLAHPIAGSTLIRNARVFDSERALLGTASCSSAPA